MSTRHRLHASLLTLARFILYYPLSTFKRHVIWNLLLYEKNVRFPSNYKTPWRMRERLERLTQFFHILLYFLESTISQSLPRFRYNVSRNDTTKSTFRTFFQPPRCFSELGKRYRRKTQPLRQSGGVQWLLRGSNRGCIGPGARDIHDFWTRFSLESRIYFFSLEIFNKKCGNITKYVFLDREFWFLRNNSLTLWSQNSWKFKEYFFSR